jgi:hypothetical protein
MCSIPEVVDPTLPSQMLDPNGEALPHSLLTYHPERVMPAESRTSSPDFRKDFFHRSPGTSILPRLSLPVPQVSEITVPEVMSTFKYPRNLHIYFSGRCEMEHASFSRCNRLAYFSKLRRIAN